MVGDRNRRRGDPDRSGHDASDRDGALAHSALARCLQMDSSIVSGPVNQIQGSRDTSLLMTVSEAATAVRISRSHFYQLVGQGQIELVHIGRLARVRRTALEAYVDSLSANPDEKSEPDAA